MQHPTPTSTEDRVEIGSLWIDPAHHHRLVEVIQITDQHHVRVRPVREHLQQPASYLETTVRLASHYQPVSP